MSRLSLPRRGTAAFVGVLLLSWASAGPVRAAGGAFTVDNAGVDDAGSCKVEAWASVARDGQRVYAAAPACAVSLGQPVEFGVQYDRLKFDGHWAHGIALKAKTSIVPLTEDARFGIAVSGGTAIGLDSGDVAAWFVNVPVSIRLTDTFQLNLNVGGLWDRIDNRNFLTWGTGFEIAVGGPFTLIGEYFGIGSDHRGAQIGLRYTPHEKIDFDLIYGHNLAGEKSDWLTLGVNLRF